MGLNLGGRPADGAGQGVEAGRGGPREKALGRTQTASQMSMKGMALVTSGIHGARPLYQTVQ